MLKRKEFNQRSAPCFGYLLNDKLTRTSVNKNNK